MRITHLALSLAVYTGVLLAQSGVDTTLPKKPGSVEGTVLNSVSHEPIKKASVTLRNLRERFTYVVMSDAAGHFLFDNVEPGSYQVSVERDGFSSVRQGRRMPAEKPIVVEEEQHIKNVATQLAPKGVVSGRVLDEDGDPIMGASVQALRYFYGPNGTILGPGATSNTNDLGEFQLINLEPARYYFRVTTPRRNFPPGHTRGARDETYPPIFYPSAMEVAQATPQEVATGAQVTGIDFRLHKMVGYRVSGKVIDGQTGQAARNTFVELRPHNIPIGMNSGMAQVQQDGTFEIRGVVSGSYTAMSQHNEGELRSSARQTLNVGDQDIENVLLTLRPGLDVPGTVTVDGTPASPQNPQQTAMPPRSTLVSLQSVEMRGGTPQTRAENDGTFVLHDVAPDVYALTVYPNIPGAYVKSIRYGDQDAPSGQIDLRQSSAPINIVLGTDVGQIQGIVQDRSGKPAAGAWITLAPRDDSASRRDRLNQTSADQNGSFQFRDVAPGEYRVFAWEDPDMNLLYAPEFRKLFESKAASVNIGSNGKESVQVTMISSEEMETEKTKLP